MTHTPTPTDIAGAIKGRLREAGISQTAVADALGIDRSALNRRLNGHQPITSTDLLALAELLNVSVAALVTAGGEAA